MDQNNNINPNQDMNTVPSVEPVPNVAPSVEPPVSMPSVEPVIENVVENQPVAPVVETPSVSVPTPEAPVVSEPTLGSVVDNQAAPVPPQPEVPAEPVVSEPIPEQPVVSEPAPSVQAPNPLGQDTIQSIPMPEQDLPAQELPGEATEKKKSSKGAKVLIFLLLIALGVALGFFLYNKFGNKDASGTPSGTSDKTNTETGDYASWMNYILNQQISSIKIERTAYVENGDPIHSEVVLSTAQLQTVFSKMMDYKLVKNYVEGTGFTFGDVLTISYILNDSDYKVTIKNSQMLYVDGVDNIDKDFVAALENSEHTVENEDIKDKETSFFVYQFTGFDSSIYDEFLK